VVEKEQRVAWRVRCGHVRANRVVDTPVDRLELALERLDGVSRSTSFTSPLVGSMVSSNW
jgi:hypothetical protein